MSACDFNAAFSNFATRSTSQRGKKHKRKSLLSLNQSRKKNRKYMSDTLRKHPHKSELLKVAPKRKLEILEEIDEENVKHLRTSVGLFHRSPLDCSKPVVTIIDHTCTPVTLRDNGHANSYPELLQCTTPVASVIHSTSTPVTLPHYQHVNPADDLNSLESSFRSNDYAETECPLDDSFLHHIIPSGTTLDGYDSDATIIDEEYVNSEKYLQKCMKSLLAEDFIPKLLAVLHDHGRLSPFMSLLKHLATGSLVDNIAFILCLERATFQDCETTTQMRFGKESKQFWETFKMVNEGKGLRLMSGSKNKGQVANSTTTQGKYDPDKANVNFAVPDEKVLNSSFTAIPCPVHPGIIDAAFSLLDPAKDYILSLDGKKISAGLGDGELGDIQLLGFEEPSVQSCKDALQRNLLVVEELSVCEDPTSTSAVDQMVSMLQVMTKDLHSIRKNELYCRRHLASLEKLGKDNPSSEKFYQYATSETKTYLYTSNDCVSKCLEFNKEWCHLLSFLRGNQSHFGAGDAMNLENQMNCRLLLPETAMPSHIALIDHPNYVHQRTDMWFRNRAVCYVSGSSSFSALGLRTVSEHKKHFDQYIAKDIEEKAVPNDLGKDNPSLQERLDWGVSHEVNYKIGAFVHCLLH
jgi:hypothetical protein